MTLQTEQFLKRFVAKRIWTDRLIIAAHGRSLKGATGPVSEEQFMKSLQIQVDLWLQNISLRVLWEIVVGSSYRAICQGPCLLRMLLTFLAICVRFSLHHFLPVNHIFNVYVESMMFHNVSQAYKAYNMTR